MAKYTLELGAIHESTNVKVFDFEYSFYDEQLKEQFEEKFINYYYFHEIGQETIGRFKKMLQAHLNLNMPYYKQLYETELKSKDINFLLNKDLKETFIRDISKDYSEELKQLGLTNYHNSATNKGSGSFKESNLENGIADLIEDKITSSSENCNTSLQNANGNNSSENNENKTGTDTQQEKTELISQGNIGITSSAELLIKWRDSIINLDKMIIEDCKHLFMIVY